MIAIYNSFQIPTKKAIPIETLELMTWKITRETLCGASLVEYCAEGESRIDIHWPKNNDTARLKAISIINELERQED